MTLLALEPALTLFAFRRDGPFCSSANSQILEQANQALGSLDGLASVLPDLSLALSRNSEYFHALVGMFEQALRSLGNYLRQTATF